MALNFPSSPTANTTYTFNGKSWTYNGSAWALTYGTLNTGVVTEGVNLYFTNARSRASISVTGSGTYDSANGIINITSSGGGSTYGDSNVALLGYATNANVALKANVIDLTTANVSELTNLYYTNARVYSNVTQLGYITAGSLSGYATNIQLASYATNTQLTSYATTTNVALKANVIDLTTANVSELTNLYFTNARSRTAISVTGSGSYDNSTGVITISGGGNGSASASVTPTAPASPSIGNFWFDTENTTMYIWTGNVWVEPAGGLTGPTGPTGPAGNTVVILKVSNVVITDNVYTTLDDTAVDTAGGYIKITGTGFASGIQVLVNQTPATSTTFVSSTEIRAQLPATQAGTYIVYVVNSDGSVGIRVNGITFSATPSWSTSSTLPSSLVNANVSIQLAANLATTYAVTSGSTIPTGLTLSANGLISGSVTGIVSETTYSFSVTATDAELQDSPRTFSITITVGDPYFSYTTLLLLGNGTNNAQNNTFLDSSANNFTMTRTGTPTQGTFSPFSLAANVEYSTATNGGSILFNSGNYLNASSNAAFAFGTGNFTVEAWVYPTSAYTTYNYVLGVAVTDGLVFYVTGGNLVVRAYNSGDILSSTGAPAQNTWTHVAATRSGTTLRIFVNGTQTANTTNSTNFAQGTPYVGNDGTNAAPWNGYISNLRVLKGTALYTGTFTPPSAPLTAVANTSILLSGTNAGIIDSTAKNLITTVGDAKISTTQSKFGGSSMYFDGTGDYLTIPSSNNYQFGTGDFTIEMWIYTNNLAAYQTLLDSRSADSALSYGLFISNTGNIYWYDASGSQTSSNAISSNTWTHIAAVRTSGVLKLFIGGTQGYSAANTNVQNPTGIFTIGKNLADSALYIGYIDDLRITKGYARYTANFTPSVSQFLGL